jgi:hypothetical protein
VSSVPGRSRGVDVRRVEGLAGGLNGTDVVIDVTDPDTIEQGPTTESWTDVVGALQRTGAGHISIALVAVGAALAPSSPRPGRRAGDAYPRSLSRRGPDRADAGRARGRTGR